VTSPQLPRRDWLDALTRSARESDRSYRVALWSSVLLGFLGADRFYLGYGWLGLLKLGTFGGFGFWWAIDVVLILSNKMTDGEGWPLRSGT